MLTPSNLCQVEIAVSDIDRALFFYEHAFGWRRTPADIYQYWVLEVPDNCPFGISLVPGKHGIDKQQIVLYFRTSTPLDILKRVPEAGGHVLFGPRKVPGYGTVYQVSDPDGHRFGLFEPLAENTKKKIRR